MPTASAEVLNVAAPLLRVPVPSVDVPSLNVTVPAGVPLPPPDAATVAVNVTLWPNIEGLMLLETDVVVEAWLIEWLVDAELVLKVPSVMYCAVRVFAPAGPDARLHEPAPPDRLPMQTFEPSLT